MRLSIRRALYVVTIALFLLVIPLILAYGVGIRYNYGTKAFVRTGGMFISTQPKNASVYLNDVLYATKTPLHIRYLPPQNYTVRITAQNFTPIEFSTQIIAGIATTIPKLELDPQNPSATTQYSAQALFSSPFSDHALVLNTTADIQKITHITRNSSEDCPTLSQAPIEVIWDPQRPQAIVAGTDAWRIISFNPCKVRATLPRDQFSSLGFSFDEDSYWGLHQDAASAVFLNGKDEISTRATGQEIRILQKGLPALTAVTTGNAAAIFFKDEKREAATIGTITNITLLSDSKVLVQSANGIFIADTKQKRFFFLDNSLTHFSIKNDALWFANGSEVWELSLETFEKKFITRFSEKITSLSLSAKGNALYVVFASSYVLWELNQPFSIFTKKELEPESRAYFQLLQENRLRKFTLLNDKLTIEDFLL